jgi:hypothetical protein
MNQPLINMIAHDEVLERIGAAERDRLARMARPAAPVATRAGLHDHARRLTSRLTSWGHRPDRNAVPPCPVDRRAEGQAP